MNHQGKKGNRFHWQRAGAEETARNALGLPSLEEMDFGEYRDGHGVPIKGINPKPKYFVVSKEAPKPLIATVKKRQQRMPLKATVKKRKQPVTVIVKKRKLPLKATVKVKPKEIHKSED